MTLLLCAVVWWQAGKEIEAMKARLSKLSEGELARAQMLADREERRLEETRYYDRWGGGGVTGGQGSHTC